LNSDFSPPVRSNLKVTKVMFRLPSRPFHKKPKPIITARAGTLLTMRRALIAIKKLLLKISSRLSSSPEIQTLNINCRLKTTANDDDVLYEFSSNKPFGPMTKTPKNQPGRVVALPKKCCVCGSTELAYDRLNVVTCQSCDSILSVSDWWHPYWGGQIDPSRNPRRPCNFRSLEGQI